MTVLSGSCLCGSRAYEIDGEIDGVLICHCSLCRKASGSTGNAILKVPVERFRWVKGEDHAVTFALRPTYSITRCRTCGTPLPAEVEEQYVYVTAGTLDTPLGRGVRMRIFCMSRADWDRDEAGTRSFDERPG